MKSDRSQKNSFSQSLDENLAEIKRISGNSSDILVNRFVSGGIHCALVCCEGMVSTSVITELVFEPITNIPEQKDSAALFHYIQEELLLSTDRPEVNDIDTFFRLLYSGFALFIAEGQPKMLGFGGICNTRSSGTFRRRKYHGCA